MRRVHKVQFNKSSRVASASENQFNDNIYVYEWGVIENNFFFVNPTAFSLERPVRYGYFSTIKQMTCKCSTTFRFVAAVPDRAANGICCCCCCCNGGRRVFIKNSLFVVGEKCLDVGSF